MPDPDDADWRRAPAEPAQLRVDLWLAAGLFVASVLSMVLWRVTGVRTDPASGTVSILLLAAVTAPLAWRRRFPSAVLVVVAVAFVIGQVVAVPETLVCNVCLFVALYTVGAWEPDRRRAFWVRAAVVVVMFGWLMIAIFRAVADPDRSSGLSNVGAFSPLAAYLLIQVLTNVVYFAGAWGFGEHAWSAARDRARTAWRTWQLAAAQRRGEEQAVALERLRIARELHDAVAHHVAAMGVQAAVASTMLDGGGTAQAQVAIEQVQDSARDAVRELASILGTLREDREREDGERVGQLGVARLPELVEHTSQAGMPVQLEVVGSAGALPPLVSLNLYRIAQEALTNSRRHAGPTARATVRLRYLPGSVELEVSDDGGGGRPLTRLPSSGLGLLGMQERVGADGGTLYVGPRSRGGFVVRATVPVTSS
ncbi:MAG: sensor histidine kinase [Actinobacteria bacterium]|nr:sensor histidine kinase [Actinomycetota bacterium]